MAARGPRWRRTSRGFYVPSTVDGELPEQRIAEASVVLPDVGGLTGWAALYWCGATWLDGLADGGRRHRPVVIATGYEDVRNQPGIVVSQERLSPRELAVHDGLPLTEPVRSVCFEARYARSLPEAVEAVDMSAFADLVSIAEYADYCLAHPGWTGIPMARAAIELADENSWSPAETRMRLVWMLVARLPRPVCNHPLFDLAGRHIGTPDLFDPEGGVAGEYDGRLHLQGSQRSRDLAREDAFRAHGIEYFTVLAEDLRRPERVAERMLAARHRAPSVPVDRRTWTLTPPEWWRPTTTVRQRRALAAAGYERLLPRHRHAAA